MTPVPFARSCSSAKEATTPWSPWPPGQPRQPQQPWGQLQRGRQGERQSSPCLGLCGVLLLLVDGPVTRGGGGAEGGAGSWGAGVSGMQLRLLPAPPSRARALLGNSSPFLSHVLGPGAWVGTGPGFPLTRQSVALG